MSYTLGIGALLDTQAFNQVRSLELLAASATGSNNGLAQPPHITVKRPFQASTLAEVRKLQRLLGEIAQRTAPFDVKYAGLGHFGDASLFLTVQPSKELQALHADLLSTLKAAFGSATAPYEGDDMVFHTSVALSLQSDQLQKATETLSDSLPTSATISKLGLFFGLDDNTHWIVLSEAELG